MVPPSSPKDTDTPQAPTPGFLKRLENQSIDGLAEMLDMPDKPKAARIAKLSPEQEEELRTIEAEAVIKFKGELTQLEAAIGMLRLGHHFGWKVLYLIHTKQTIRNYEEILGVKIREIFQETGPSSYRSVGLNIAERFSNFWKVAGGTIKIPRRRDTT